MGFCWLGTWISSPVPTVRPLPGGQLGSLHIPHPPHRRPLGIFCSGEGQSKGKTGVPPPCKFWETGRPPTEGVPEGCSGCRGKWGGVSQPLARPPASLHKHKPFPLPPERTPRSTRSLSGRCTSQESSSGSGCLYKWNLMQSGL